jgi:hypothetical protein
MPATLLPPVPRTLILPRDASTPPQPDACACNRVYNLAVQQGVDLNSQITIALNGVPVDVTGAEFQFTAKTDPTIPDDDPSTVKVDWQETNTPTQGITWLKVPAATTQVMQPVGYVYQVRMVASTGVVTALFNGTLTILVPPASSRF